MGLFRRNKVWWMTFIHQGQQVRRSTGTTDKRLAKRFSGKVRVKIVEGRFFDTLEAKDHTFNDMMDRYLKERSITKAYKPTAGRTMPHAFTKCVWISLNLAEVTPKLLAAYKAKRRETAKPATVNKELGLVRHSFNVAIREWEWCRDNPMQRVCMEKVRNERDRWLSSDEESPITGSFGTVAAGHHCLCLKHRHAARRDSQLAVASHRPQSAGPGGDAKQERREAYCPLNGRLTELLKRKASKRTAGSFVFASSARRYSTLRNLTRAFRLAATGNSVERATAFTI